MSNDISIYPHEFGELDDKMRRLEESLGKPLSDPERNTWEDFFLSQLNRVSKEEEKEVISMLANICIGSYALGFNPSECHSAVLKMLELLNKPEDERNKWKEWGFWKACIFLSLWLPDKIDGLAEENSAAIVDLIIQNLDEALEEPLLLRKMVFASFQLELTCYISQSKYQEALNTLRILENHLQTNAGRFRSIEMDGYIHALWDYNIQELTWIINLNLPEGEYQEYIPANPRTEQKITTTPLDINIAIAQRVIDDTSKRVIDDFSEKLTASYEQIRKEFSQTREDIKKLGYATLENVNLDLISNRGSWIEKLCNPGALINAEFLYNALNKRSFGEVIMGFCNCVEAEISKNIVEPLEAFLDSNKKTRRIQLKSRKFSIEVKYDMDLADVQAILSEITTQKDLNGFLSLFPSDTHDFIIRELPKAINDIRGFRNSPKGDAAAHGGIKNSAEKIRYLVLGNPENPGLLEKLTKLKKTDYLSKLNLR